jgi:isopentenyl diphosphate isomerase/L-lactate dehydrogenase-like FMN-dependent dehydrogenase
MSVKPIQTWENLFSLKFIAHEKMSAQDISVELFGQSYDNPVIMAPVALASFETAAHCQQGDLRRINASGDTKAMLYVVFT